jgi:hypothetical protein
MDNESENKPATNSIVDLIELNSIEASQKHFAQISSEILSSLKRFWKYKNYTDSSTEDLRREINYVLKEHQLEIESQFKSGYQTNLLSNFEELRTFLETKRGGSK